MNKTKTKNVRRILPALALLCTVFLLISVLNTRDYATSDAISRADIDTRNILACYEETEDAKEIRIWLVDGPSEGPKTQISLTFSEWALQHQDEFASIVEGLPEKQQAPFIESFCGALNQSDTTEFKAAFGNNKSKIIMAIFKNLA